MKKKFNEFNEIGSSIALKYLEEIYDVGCISTDV